MAETSENSAVNAICHDSEALPAGRYLHFKGKHYEVLYTARHCDTGEDFVVYRALYGDFGIWIRPLADFTATITRDGTTVPRFRRVSL